MSKIHFTIPYPTFIENIIVYFLLRYRKKHYGFAFRRIKLITDKHVDIKYQYAIVSPEDYQKLSQYPWQLWEPKSNIYYAVQYFGRKIIYMHRQIMNAPKGKIVDHRDRNGLNNTRQNLRFATHSQNSYNRKRAKAGSSKYRGVCYVKEYKKWDAYIAYNRIRKRLGSFDNEEDAARAYDEAAKIYHGEFAVLNFPQVAAKPLAKTDGEFAVLNFPQVAAKPLAKTDGEFAVLNFPQVAAKPLAKTDGEFAVLNFTTEPQRTQSGTELLL